MTHQETLAFHRSATLSTSSLIVFSEVFEEGDDAQTEGGEADEVETGDGNEGVEDEDELVLEHAPPTSDYTTSDNDDFASDYAPSNDRDFDDTTEALRSEPEDEAAELSYLLGSRRQIVGYRYRAFDRSTSPYPSEEHGEGEGEKGDGSGETVDDVPQWLLTELGFSGMDEDRNEGGSDSDDDADADVEDSPVVFSAPSPLKRRCSSRSSGAVHYAYTKRGYRKEPYRGGDNV